MAMAWGGTSSNSARIMADDDEIYLNYGKRVLNLCHILKV